MRKDRNRNLLNFSLSTPLARVEGAYGTKHSFKADQEELRTTDG